MYIRKAEQNDLSQVLELYSHLHNNTFPTVDERIEGIWKQILDDPNHHLLVGLEHNRVVSSCVIIIVPNLTQNQRPYALVENVITHPEHRGKGYASQLLDYAKGIAIDHNCYKIMLMTGSKLESTMKFYERAGYNRTDKTAFIQWHNV